MQYRWATIILTFALVGCDAGEHFAPVADASYSHGAIYAPRPPILMASSQKAITKPKTKKIIPVPQLTKPQSAKSSREVMVANALSSAKSSRWQWPVQGRVVTPYSQASKGVAIANRLGEPILAAAPGTVVYSGNGIKGYGNLIIIKHDKAYMTTYAHNHRVFVRAGQVVKKGQKIAEMGKSESSSVKLYFQVRYRGKPINPKSII